MIYVPLVLFCVAFLELFIFFDIRKSAVEIITRSQESVRVLMSSEMGDDEKEAFMRRGSVELFKATGLFSFKFFLIFATLYLMYLLLITIFPSLGDTLINSFLSPSVIVILTIVTMCYAWARNAVLKQL